MVDRFKFYVSLYFILDITDLHCTKLDKIYLLQKVLTTVVIPVNFFRVQV